MSKAAESLLSSPTFMDDAGHQAWDYKATIAYWTTCMTIEGAILFSVGSLMMYPGMKPEDEEHEYVERAWVEYPFFFGGWCFTFGNYLSYLQVINQNKQDHSKGGIKQVKKSTYLFTWPAGQTDKGHIASLLNVVGALWYNIGTTTMFGFPPVSPMLYYNLDYVTTGIIGSLCFAVAGVLQGEYNNWRNCKASLPVAISHMNFWGSVLFLIGYGVNINKYASSFGVDSFMVLYGVDFTFLVGSLCFLVGAWLDLIMWQQERYGLGFAKKLENYSEVRADRNQLLTIAVTILNICFAWIRMSFAYSEPSSRFTESGLCWSIAEKLIAYHGILFLLSILHKVPDQHPWDYLTYAMRFIAGFGLVGQCVELHALIVFYTYGKF